jgi:hypothetical protein
MKPTLNEKFLAYLALFSGLFLSLVAEYYSILGLTSIFSAAVIPVVVMGIALGLGKISATLWLKQNWKIAPWSMRLYLFTAIMVLMIVTSMGIFGFLSKAHSDQSLVSGDVLAKISIYDEKIKTEKENIETNRKALKQMDEAVDQVMGRSSSETGADKAVAIRRSQQKERGRLQQDIAQSQQTIAALNEQRAPIAAEVRKVEAEVGPIKYIAAFIYGETDQTILEKAVTWVIVILIVVFDPMAVILLLASQISFQRFREQRAEGDSPSGPVVDIVSPEPTVTNLDDVEPVHFEWKEQGITAQEVADVIPEAVIVEEKSLLEQHPYLNQPFAHFKNLEPMVYKPEENKDQEWERWVEHAEVPDVAPLIEPVETTSITEEVVQQALAETHEVKSHGSGQYIVIDGQTYNRNSIPPSLQNYVQNEEQRDSNLWSVATGNPIQPEDYFKTSKTKKE